MADESRADMCRQLLVQYGEVRDLLTGMVRCPHLGADLTQEAYRRAFRSLEPLGHVRDLRAWLRTIARNVGRDYIRRRRRGPATWRSHTLVEEIESNGVPVDELSDWNIERQDLMAAIDALSPISKELILGYYFDGKRCSTLGIELGIGRENVKVRLYRARRSLRKLLRREGKG